MGSIFHNITYPQSIYLGTSSVSKIMKGDIQVWPGDSQTPPDGSELSFPNGHSDPTGCVTIRTNFNSDGQMLSRGIAYEITPGVPSINGNKVILASTTGVIDTYISGLALGTYNFWAYASNSAGLTYYPTTPFQFTVD